METPRPDSNGRALAPDRFWNAEIETIFAGDDEGPCMGIKLNIWERMKVSNLFDVYRHYVFYLHYQHYIHCCWIPSTGTSPYDVISCTPWWEAEGSRGYSTPWITAKYIRETLASWAITKFSQFCRTNLLGFCLNHSHRFESLDLPQLSAERSEFDVHGALLDDNDKVQNKISYSVVQQVLSIAMHEYFLYLL